MLHLCLVVFLFFLGAFNRYFGASTEFKRCGFICLFELHVIRGEVNVVLVMVLGAVMFSSKQAQNFHATLTLVWARQFQHLKPVPWMMCAVLGGDQHVGQAIPVAFVPRSRMSLQ